MPTATPADPLTKMFGNFAGNTKVTFFLNEHGKAISKTVLKMQCLPGIVIKDEQGKTNKNFAIISKHKSDFVLQEDFKIKICT